MKLRSRKEKNTILRPLAGKTCITKKHATFVVLKDALFLERFKNSWQRFSALFTLGEKHSILKLGITKFDPLYNFPYTQDTSLCSVINQPYCETKILLEVLLLFVLFNDDVNDKACSACLSLSYSLCVVSGGCVAWTERTE